MNDLSLPANYRYWQENGSSWVEEYSWRKKTQILYDIQEFMLAEYMARSAPASVLEFGCGIGRHLKYLRQIPGLEIFGFDQSPTMLEGIQSWAEQDWLKQHIILGEPIGMLPYPDHCFDIVFTAEVLIHVRPDDLPLILSELIRVAKWQVFHLEPAPDYVITPDAHQGCWNHNLIQEYTNLGYLCEILPRGFRVQAPYRVILDKSRPIPSTFVPFDKLFEMETDIQPMLDQFFQLSRDLNIIQQELSKTQQEGEAIQQELSKTQQERDAIQHEFISLQNAYHMLIEERNSIAIDRDNIKSDRDIVITERDNLQQECDNIKSEYAILLHDINQIKQTRGYRLMRVIQESRPIRILVRILQRLFPKYYNLSN